MPLSEYGEQWAKRQHNPFTDDEAEKPPWHDQMEDWVDGLQPDDAPPSSDPLPPIEGMPRLWRATDLKPAAQVRWLAKGRLQRAATNLLVGEEGIGKSLLWVWVTAAVTTGKPLPEFGIPARRPATVIAVCTEDDWQTTVRPRLEVAGADLSMVTMICTEQDGSGAPVFPRDGFLVLEADPPPALVVVDAWLDTVAGSLTVRDPQQARAALHPWKEIATVTDAAVLLLVHTNRLSTASARDRYGATYALRQKARMTLFAQSAEDDGRLLVGPEKMNNGSPVPASSFIIRPIQYFPPTDEGDGTVPLLTYTGDSDRTARQHVADSFQDEHGDDRTTVDVAAGWLQSYLEVEGPYADSAEAKRLAAKAGIKERTLQRACRKVGVVYGRSGFGKDTRVTWSLSVHVGATGATGADEDISAGHTVTPQSRQEPTAGVTEAQLTDQQKQEENHQSRQSRQKEGDGS